VPLLFHTAYTFLSSKKCRLGAYFLLGKRDKFLKNLTDKPCLKPGTSSSSSGGGSGGGSSSSSSSGRSNHSATPPSLEDYSTGKPTQLNII